jgi:hypothetical protein
MDETEIEATLTTLLQSQHGLSTTAWIERLDRYTQKFFESPYLFDPIGEGPEGRFDQMPLFRFDCFDCVTYVNIVLALCFAADVSQFKKIFKKISYASESPQYEFRTSRFWCADWNRHNAQNRLVKNVTPFFVNTERKHIAEIAHAVIDRPNWFARRTDKDIRMLEPLSPEQAKDRLSQLQAIALLQSPQKSALYYLPLDQIVNKQGRFFDWFVQQMPRAAIVEIVRPNWDIKEKIGTDLNVSHVGFAFRIENRIVFRHASSLAGKVLEVPLGEYLSSYLEKSSDVPGIHVLEICHGMG